MYHFVINPISHGIFLNRQSWSGMSPPPPHYNFVVIPSMNMKFGTVIKLGIFYTMVTKKFVMSLLLRKYDIITYILANA